MPLKSRQRRTNAPEYLFVNQDAGSLLSDKKNSRVNQSKQVHVQRLYFARKREAALKALQGASSASISSNDQTQVLPDTEVAHDLNEGTFLYRPSNRLQSLDLVHNQTSDRQSGPPAHRIGSLKSRQLAFETTNTGLDLFTPTEIPRPRQGFSLDPFSSTAIELHPAAPSLMQYYASNLMPSMFPADSGSSTRSAMRHLRAFQQDMHDCMTDEGHMYALLSSTSVHMQRWQGQLLVPGLEAGAKDISPLYFKMRAIAIVRQRLVEGHLDLGMFQDIYRLMSAETMLGNVSEAETHFKALFAVVEALGGLDALDEYSKERIIHSDLYGAVQSLRSPRLPLTWDPGNLPAVTHTKILQDTPLPQLGSQFLEGGLSDLFHPAMQNILSDVTTVFRITIYSWQHADLTQDEISWLSLKRSAVDHRLLAFPTTYRRPGDHNFVQECTRIATLFWIGMTTPSAVCRELLAPYNLHLRGVLERSGLQSLWYPHSALLLWIATIGALMADSEEEYTWFGTLSAKVASYLQVTDEGDLKDVLRGFLYMDELQHEDLSKLVSMFDTYVRTAKTQVRYYDLSTTASSTSSVTTSPFP